MDKRGLNLRTKINTLLVVMACVVLMSPAQAYPDADIGLTAAGSGGKIHGPELDVNELLEYRAELGLTNLLPHSLVLMDEGLKAYEEGRKSEAAVLFSDARQLSPSLPSPFFYVAKTNLSLNPVKLNKSAWQMLDAWKVFRNNFWWSFQTAGVLFVSFFVSIHVSIFLIILTLIISKFNLYAHDIVEDKRKLYLLAAPVLVVFFGPILGMIGFILPFWIYLSKRERIVMYSAVGLLAAFILMLPFYSSFIGASEDKILRDVVSVNEGVYSGVLREARIGADVSNDVLFSYAINERRSGRHEKAIEIYGTILKHGDDAKSFNNIANSYVGMGEYEKASDYYKKALRKAKLASANFNLSQLHREVLRFRDAEQYYDKANAIDPERVTFYNSIKGMSANRFVMDEKLTNDDLWRLAFDRSPLYRSSALLGEIRSFSNKELSLLLFFLLILAVSIYWKQVAFGAYCCRRCGEIYCSSCEKRISHEEVCIKCFKTLVKVSEMGSRERIERILEIQRFRDIKNMRLKILTVLYPGAGHIYYGWTVQGTAILLSFTFFVFSALFWSLTSLPVAMSQMASFLAGVSVAGFILVYGISVISVFRGTPKRWR